MDSNFHYSNNTTRKGKKEVLSYLLTKYCIERLPKVPIGS